MFQIDDLHPRSPKRQQVPWREGHRILELRPNKRYELGQQVCVRAREYKENMAPIIVQPRQQRCLLLLHDAEQGREAEADSEERMPLEQL